MSKILIAVPTFENIYPDTYKSIFDLDKGGHEVSFSFVRGYDVATARNKIAQKAIDGGFDYVLMVDNDVVLPLDALINLLDDPKDVCLGYYAHRDEDNIYRGRTCVCKLKGPDGKLYFDYVLESEYTAEELGRIRADGERKIWIHGGGMGCALIRTDVFRKIPYPWYDWVNYANKERHMLTEDLYFCEQCKKAGVLIFTDARVACGHMLRHVQWPVWHNPEGKYRVLALFDDLQDKVPTPYGYMSWRYYPGDAYPRKGAEPLPERIDELSGSRNALGKPLIEAVAVEAKGNETEELEKEPVAEEPEEASEAAGPAKTARRKKTVKKE